MAIDPEIAKLNFRGRLDLLKKDTETNYALKLREQTNRNKWPPALQQTLHVCHMFIYNKYEFNSPKFADDDDRISWKHLSSPNTVWKLADPTELLRTKGDGKVIKGSATAWNPISVPDEQATRKNMLSVLAKAGIGGPGHSAMVAPGATPCPSPCQCKATASKHLTGEASDLVSADLDVLTAELAKEKDPAERKTLDQYFAAYGLWFKLKNAKNSPERWHLEAVPHDFPKHLHNVKGKRTSAGQTTNKTPPHC